MTEHSITRRGLSRGVVVTLLLGLGAIGILVVYGYRKWEDASDRST